MITFEDYMEKQKKYEHRQFNTAQWKSKYARYVKSRKKAVERLVRNASTQQGKVPTVDEQWIETRSQIDLTHCRLLQILMEFKDSSGIIELRQNAGPLIECIDPAHVISRGSAPHMKYDIDNIVPLNRFSHSCMDQSRDPVTGRQVTGEVITEWWKILVGPEKYDELEARKFSRRKYGEEKSS